MRRRAASGGFCATVAILLAAFALPACAQDGTAARALADYVAKSDASYEWRIHGRYRHRGADVLELRLHSQTWRGALWKHQLLLIKPRGVADDGQALLIVGGGRWRAEYETASATVSLPEDAELFVAIARRLQTVVAVLGQVPYQPLFDLTEDRLIAHTFEQYLQTGDPEWPLLLPMVKSAVRAMDASDAAALREWGAALKRFTVLGGSKRGWTTWLVAAVDPRVAAIAPAVIDALNMERHFPYQSEVWGAPSEEIRPYTDLNLHYVLGNEQGRALRQIVDPYSYRATLTQPKLVVLATNDPYFPVDSANLYWDELEEPKYLLYLPNEQHSIDDYRRLVASLRALHRAVGGGTALPRFDWEYRWSDTGLMLCVRADPEPRAIDYWVATSDDRDFRDARWQIAPSSPDRSTRSFEVVRPEAGFVAVFAEATFGRGRSAYTLSTNLAVIASANLEPQPSGQSGVCAPLFAEEAFIPATNASLDPRIPTIGVLSSAAVYWPSRDGRVRGAEGDHKSVTEKS